MKFTGVKKIAIITIAVCSLFLAAIIAILIQENPIEFQSNPAVELLIYTKSGGFAPIEQKVIIDFKTREITIKRNSLESSDTLDEITLLELTKTIEENEFFEIDSDIYSQYPICYDCRSYTLSIVSGNVSNEIKWHDGSKILPNHQAIVSEINEIIPGIRMKN